VTGKPNGDTMDICSVFTAEMVWNDEIIYFSIPNTTVICCVFAEMVWYVKIIYFPTAPLLKDSGSRFYFF
jgi:hypothetical protein